MSNSDIIFESGMHIYDHLVIHTPHAGKILPIVVNGPQGRGGYERRKGLTPIFNKLTDHYTDKLFSTTLINTTQVSFPYSRLFCDVERLVDDPLEQKGLGICPNFGIYKDSGTVHTWNMTKKQAMELYQKHHQTLYHSMSLEKVGGNLLLDCHSFSEHDNVLCPNAHEYTDIEICLGYNEDISKPSPDTLEGVAHFFSQRGYRVAFNVPFSNAMTVGNESFLNESLMIEVNKHCYMNEETLEINDGYYKLHNELQELYKLLLK